MLYEKLYILARYFYQYLHKNDDRKPANFVTRGVYAYHVKHWQKYFPPSQLLFINGRDLMTNPGRSLMEIQNFIGVAPVLNETNFWFNQVGISEIFFFNFHVIFLDKWILLSNFWQG